MLILLDLSYLKFVILAMEILINLGCEKPQQDCCPVGGRGKPPDTIQTRQLVLYVVFYILLLHYILCFYSTYSIISMDFRRILLTK